MISKFALGAAASMIALAGAADAAVLHINDSGGRLGTVDTDTGAVTVIGATGISLTDIAFAPNGDLYGISFDRIYRIDPATAQTTLVGDHGVSGGNALVFGADGTLYAAGANSTQLFTIDTATGTGTSLGDTGVRSGGDLAFVEGQLYLASAQGDLVAIDLAAVSATTIGSFGVGNVFGISSPGDGTLFGVGGTTIFQVDLGTGAALGALSYAGQGLSAAFGQSFFGEAVPPAMDAVPLPGAFVLFGTAMAGAGYARKRRAGA